MAISPKAGWRTASLALYLPFPEAEPGYPGEPDDLLDVFKLMGLNAHTTKPVPLNRPRPAYTAEARSAHVQGIVSARARIGSDGKVKDVELVDHLPCGLDNEAIRAIKRMWFRPATLGGKLTEAWTEVKVDFGPRVPRK